MNFLKYALLIALTLGSVAHADYGFKRQPFTEVVYYGVVSSTPPGTIPGKDSTNPKAIVDGTVWAIPAGTVIDDVQIVVDTGLVGLTTFVLGDDDSSNGFITDATQTLASAGLYVSAAYLKGSYLKEQVGGNVYNTYARSKYYSATKNVKLDVTGTVTAGAFRIIIKGFRL